LCPGLGVDTRLYDVAEWPRRRPGVLRREDLPRLTLALVAVVRKRGKARPYRTRSVSYVRIVTSEVSLAVLKTDWEKIEPLILDGVFDPQMVPVGQRAVYLYPYVAHDEPVLDWADRALYYYLLGQLQLVFTETYPTSNL